MPDSQFNDPPEIRNCSSRVIALLGTGVSLVLFVFLTLCYARQYDACAAVTVYPSWVWFLCGIILVLVTLKTSGKWTAVLNFCLWFLFLVVFADTPLSLLRGNYVSEQQPTFRVISLNSSGDKKSILALKAWNADLILIQESPGIGNLKTVADELFGAEGNMLPGVDASLMARGEIELIDTTGNYTIGKVMLPTGREIAVVSVRLSTPPFRFDLWNPDCWRAFREHRIKQRAEIVAIANALRELPTETPVIVGGDFNAHPRDAIFAELPTSLRDSFSIAGRGWGNTITNDAPFLRIDQIWADDSFQPVQVVSETTVDTDHRAVIADFTLK